MSELHTKLGRLLKTERERQNRTLSDISHELKIAEGHLLAIEAGDIGGVPSELYFKLFARSYSEALGIDYAKAVEIIREDMGETEPIDESESVIPTVRPSHRAVSSSRTLAEGRRSIGQWAIILFGAGILAAVTWLVLSNQDSFVLGDRNGTEAASDETTGADDSGIGNLAASREDMLLNLDLIARDRTWAVVIADGDTVLQTNLKPWREYYVGAQESLTVSIGAPLAVELMLNGSGANLRDPESGTISSVTVTPENLTMFVRRASEDSEADTGRAPDSAATAPDSLTPGQGAHNTGRISAPLRSASPDTTTMVAGGIDGR